MHIYSQKVVYWFFGEGKIHAQPFNTERAKLIFVLKVYLMFANGENELCTYIIQKQVQIQGTNTCMLTHYKSSVGAQLTVSGISSEKYM